MSIPATSTGSWQISTSQLPPRLLPTTTTIRWFFGSLTHFFTKNMPSNNNWVYWLKQPDDPPSGGFDAMMLRMARDGHLKDLTSLQCFQVIKVTGFTQVSFSSVFQWMTPMMLIFFQWDVSLETMLFIVDSCPQLRDIWGLDLLMLSPASISAIQSHIRRNNRWIGKFHLGFFSFLFD